MAKPRSPKTPQRPDLRWPELAEVDGEGLVGGDRREGERYLRTDLTGADLGFTSFNECEFAGVRLHETDLRSHHLVESALRDVEAPVFAMPRSVWRGVEVQRSRLGSVEAYETSWQSVLVSDSKLGYVNARSADWKDVTFERCVIEELDLTYAKLARVTFVDCTVDHLHLTEARLTDVDLRGAELHVIDGLGGLAGGWIGEAQLTALAPLLAAHLKIHVA